ncbi:RagB/SusD family nutrient uptake outer membrane protein [Marinilabiliaceae bacterium ANBcel2]|nr:RagB/SusD family nutrient uptake outer membrane protein [Marinilabiliaceae bacterium ANBcel2]
MKKLIILFFGLLFMASCDDFLEESPKSEMSIHQYFSDPSHAYNSVNRLYRDGVPSFFHAGSAYRGTTMMLGGYMSGFFDNPEYKGQEVHVIECHNLTLTPVNISGFLDDVWTPCYVAIARANTAIKYIPDTPGLSDSEKNQLLGQAYFFRALNYFHLVKIFGDVPLTIEPYESLEDIYLERSSAEIVYNQIINDLLFVIDNSSLNNEPMPMNNYRISKGSAKALLADVYLTISGEAVNIDKYADAANVARDIITSGNYSLISHDDEDLKKSAYNTIRTSNTEREYLYVIEYDAGIATNGWLPTYCYPNVAATWGVFQYSITNNSYKPVEELLAVYDSNNDLRIQEKQFFHSSLTYMENGEERTREYEPSPYLWHDDEALFETGRSGKDVAVYRLAEVYLIAAEAIARSEGVTSEAVEYLAEVRSRGYWQTEKSDIINLLSTLSEQEFVEEVWKERLRELPLEFRIWSDMQRTRKYPLTDINNPGEVDFVDLVGQTNVWGSTFEEKHLLFPISNNERQRNPNLTQNPGYSDAIE